MLEYQREECSVSHVQIGVSLFCQCGIPFADRHRTVPCYHVICSTCAAVANSCHVCPLCKGQIGDLQKLHPNEELFICTIKNCNCGFLNFPSLRVHAKLTHDFDATSATDFYGKSGDITLQFDSVHKIPQGQEKDEQDTFQDIDEVKKEGDVVDVTQSKPMYAPQKHTHVPEIDQDMKNYDDLEDLM